ncbi:MAG: hypothetical protein OEZ06_09835 [Myxococcales bacterium]|nr:hypothetical protein [Myxococcales bacterium]
MARSYTMLALLFYLASTAAGTALALALRLPLGPWTRLGLGVVLGQLLMAWTPLLWALALDLDARSAGLVATATLAAAAALAALASKSLRAALNPLVRELQSGLAATRNRPALMASVLLLPLFAWLHHSHYLRPGPGGLHSAGVTWGDLPIHLGLASRFLHADGLPRLEHPLFLGGALHYPFVADYQAAVLSSLGLSLRWAFIGGGLVPLASMLPLMHGLTTLWLGRSRPAVTALALLLFFCAGGLGFLLFAMHLADGKSFLELLATTNATYIDPHVLKSGHLGNLFIAARTAAYGMPMAVGALLLLGHVVAAPKHQAPVAALAIGGLIVGALPLIHGHSFAVLCGAGVCYAFLSRHHLRAWALHGLVLATLATPQLLWLFATETSGPGPSWAGGFLRPAPNESEWLFDLVMGVGAWLALVPLAFAALAPSGRRLTLPLLLLLPIANLITLTPTVYDNVKLLAFFDVAAAPLVAALLFDFARRPAARLARSLVAVLAVMLATASGVLALGFELINDSVLLKPRDIELAELVKAKTRPDQIIATAASYHDPVALLSGRRVLACTLPMLATHGIDARQRALEVMTLYRGGPASRRIIEHHRVTAIVVGDRERSDLPQIDEAFLGSIARSVHGRNGQRLYLLE